MMIRVRSGVRLWSDVEEDGLDLSLEPDALHGLLTAPRVAVSLGYRAPNEAYAVRQHPEGFDCAFEPQEIKFTGRRLQCIHHARDHMRVEHGFRVDLAEDVATAAQSTLPKLFEVSARTGAIRPLLEELLGRWPSHEELGVVAALAARIVLDGWPLDKTLDGMMDDAPPGVDLRRVIVRRGIPGLLSGSMASVASS